MSVVLPLPLPPRSPHHYPLSRSSTPTPSPTRNLSRPSTPPTSSSANRISSRPTTPTPMSTISAPPTPITTTHLIPHPALPCGAGMERCQSSEAILGRPLTFGSNLGGGGGGSHEMIRDRSRDGSRDGRRREVKATSLLFKTVPSLEQIVAAEREASPQREITSVDTLECTAAAEKMDLDHDVDLRDTETENALNGEVGQQQQQVAEGEHRPGDESLQPTIWGMPAWGREEERKEVRPGVRLVGMEELPGLIERHAMLDVPSHVLFPWLHGICDDGHRGREMASFFGHAPPFEPPAYRGLCVMLCPPHPLDESNDRPKSSAMQSVEPENPSTTTSSIPARERSETMSTSSDSYYSSAGTTEGTSPSLMSWTETHSPTKSDSPPTPQTAVGSVPVTPATPAPFPSSVEIHNKNLTYEGNKMDHHDEDSDEMDVVMHPLESKRVSPEAIAKGLDQPQHPFPCEGSTGCDTPNANEAPSSNSMPDGSSESSDMEEDDDDDDDDEVDDDDDESRPSCILLNALHVKDIFDLPHGNGGNAPRFRPARLPPQINLRNLHIQQIKYATISDIVLYGKHGVGAGVLETASMIAHAQEALWQERMQEYYAYHKNGEGEALDRPVKYGVWVVVEPFSKLEKFRPDLVCVDSRSHLTVTSSHIDLFEREAYESRAMTRGSEVLDRFWVGNDCDVPGGADDGAGARMTFDLCVRASECSEMPNAAILNSKLRQLQDLERRRHAEETPTWAPTPATLALRHLLSPSQPSTPVSPSSSSENGKRLASPSPSEETARRQQRSRHDTEYVALDCAGSCRTITGQMRNLNIMTDKVVELVYFLRKVIDGKDSKGHHSLNRRILVHCQDGYTESSILVLSYIMCALGVSLPEAYLHLQNKAKRSFFLYTSDKPLLRRIDAKLTADRKAKALKVGNGDGVTPPSPSTSTGRTDALSNGHTRTSSRWRSWGMTLNGSGGSGGHSRSNSEVSTGGGNDKGPSGVGTGGAAVHSNANGFGDGEAKIDEEAEEEALRKADVWFKDKRFDGFPSRILPFLYLGNLEHAGNAAMLHALGISHVVSVGESLLMDTPFAGHDKCGDNTLAVEALAGRIQVLDLTDVRDDGNDPLRPLIARACTWIEQARQNGGNVLVHCRVGVSRSASIVIAYMMQHLRMGLMDAYLMTRARRLNVLIQPNLRFFHELFGWEVELAKRAAEEAEQRRREAENAGVRDPQALSLIDDQYRRRIIYSWPSFCRDVHCLNRRFLCQ